MLFRVLLALVTALLVARPFVLGEDPGLLAPESDPGGLVFTLLWFLAGTAWAAWRLWLGPERSGVGATPGFVEVGWLGVVALMFVSAAVAAVYQHPAWMIAWEWLALWLGFVLVRQLFTSTDAQQGLLTALLATCVTVSIFGIYQGTVQLPQMAREFGADESISEMFRKRILDGHVYSTFAHPNSFAGYLVLLLPALVGAGYLALRRGTAPVVLTGAVFCAGLGIWALWLTHSRGAILALVLAGGAAAAWAWRRVLRAHLLAVGLGAAVLVGLGALVVWQGWLNTALGKDTTTASVRLDYWKATWAMIEEHPWFGVGPGNFGRAYPHYMSPRADELIKDPHNLVLELWATAGPLAVVCLAVAMLAFFLAPLRSREGEAPAEPTQAPSASAGTTQAPSASAGTQTPGASAGIQHRPVAGAPGLSGPARRESRHLEEDAEPRFRWEFYLGGMLGLILGFVLHVVANPPLGYVISPADRIQGEGVIAAIRSLFWFASFAVLERIDWSARVRGLVLTAGAGALLLNLLVSGGIGFPSVACLLLAVMALALNSWGERPLAWPRPSRLLLTLPVPALIALTLIYFVTVFYPVTAAATLRHRALAGGRFLIEKNRVLGSRRANEVLVGKLEGAVLAPLTQALALDPGDARIPLDLAKWEAQIWAVDPHDEKHARLAVAWAEVAIQRDPESLDGYQTLYELRKMFASRKEQSLEQVTYRLSSPVRCWLFGGAYQVAYLADQRKTKPDEFTAYQKKLEENLKEAKNQHRFAAEALARYLPRDPTNVEVRYLVADAWFQAGDLERARNLALEALLLDKQLTHPSRKLTDEQRERLSRLFQGATAPGG
jgi:O-antigen ligase